MDGLKDDTRRFLEHTLRGFIGLARDAGDYESLVEVVKGSQLPELFEAHGRFAMSDPDVARLVHERYTPPPMPPPYDMDRLLAMPAGSLGHEYAHFLVSQGLSADTIIEDFDSQPCWERDVDYLWSRRFRTHDIHHLLANFDTSMAGEVGVAAIYYVQLRNPVGPVVMAGVLSHAILEPEWLEPLAQAIAHGFRVGKDARNLFAFKYEEGWERPLDEWRAEIGIEIPPTISTHELERAWHEAH